MKKLIIRIVDPSIKSFNLAFTMFRRFSSLVSRSNSPLLQKRYSSTVSGAGGPRRERGDTSKLFVALSDLNNYGIKLSNFPVLGVIGPQSSGKSSVLEAICGKRILPKQMGMATLKPTFLTTIRSNEEKFVIGSKEIKTEEGARDEIERLNLNSHINEIDVRIHSNDVYNSYLVDFPGLFYVSKDDPQLPKKVRKMSEKFLNDINNIPVVVSSAPQDPATNQGIQLLQKYNRENEAMGIITKTDLTHRMNTNIIESMLRGEQYQLGYGYVSIVLRNKQDVDSGMTVAEKLEEEKEFYDSHPNFRPAGVLTMRKMISDIQFERIKDNIPKLLDDIDAKITQLKESENFLERLVNDPNNQLSIRLRMMIEKLVGSSLERAEFEDELKHEFKREIGSLINSTFPSEKGYLPVMSDDSVDSGIFAYHSNHKSNPENYKVDSFAELFSYGLISPILANNETITKSFDYEKSLGCSMPMFDLNLNDPMGKQRLQWNKYLRRYFTNLLENDNIQKLVYDITERKILSYIYQDPEGCDELTRQFAEYIIKEIGSEAYESKIRFSITAMINMQKRPKISPYELSRHLAYIYKDQLKFDGSLSESIFSNKNKKIKVEVYGETWNDAYLRAVSEELAENCYRNVAVNLLDNMVEKLLEMTIDMFNKENAIKEKNKVNDKVKTLKELKEIIADYQKN